MLYFSPGRRRPTRAAGRKWNSAQELVRGTRAGGRRPSVAPAEQSEDGVSHGDLGDP